MTSLIELVKIGLTDRCCPRIKDLTVDINGPNVIINGSVRKWYDRQMVGWYAFKALGDSGKYGLINNLVVTKA